MTDIPGTVPMYKCEQCDTKVGAAYATIVYCGHCGGRMEETYED